MEMKRVRVLIKGRVQGVFFRAYTRDAAAEIGVSGWVRNRADGRVEALFEGEREKVDRMIAWCHQGSPLSRVETVDIQEEAYLGDQDRFDINYGR
jgi:acylphosphatase